MFEAMCCAYLHVLVSCFLILSVKWQISLISRILGKVKNCERFLLPFLLYHKLLGILELLQDLKILKGKVHSQIKF